MTQNEVLNLILAQQKEIYQSVQVSNILALLGRALELGMLWMLHHCWRLLEKR